MRNLGWEAFLDRAPERVVGIVRDGPTPTRDLDWDPTNTTARRWGLARYNESANGSPGRSTMGDPYRVVYFDPQFVTVANIIDIPDEVERRHAPERRREAWHAVNRVEV